MPIGIYKRTIEHNNNISKARKGYKPNANQIEALKLGPESLKGKTRPENVRIAISKGNKNKPKSAEHCKALSLAHMGNIPTKKTKEKMSLSHIGKLKGHKYKGTIARHHLDLCHGKKDPLNLVDMLFEDHTKLHNALRLFEVSKRYLMQFDILNTVTSLRKKQKRFYPRYV